MLIVKPLSNSPSPRPISRVTPPPLPRLTESSQTLSLLCVFISSYSDQKISSTPLSVPLSRRAQLNDPSVEKFVLDEIAKLAKAAQSDGEKNGIVILVDACAIRHHVRDEVKELCEKTGFPVYAAPMGKTAVSEEYERYGGVCLFLSIY